MQECNLRSRGLKQIATYFSKVNINHLKSVNLNATVCMPFVTYLGLWCLTYFYLTILKHQAFLCINNYVTETFTDLYYRPFYINIH